jgi:hypothetical protein
MLQRLNWAWMVIYCSRDLSELILTHQNVKEANWIVKRTHIAHCHDFIQDPRHRRNLDGLGSMIDIQPIVAAYLNQIAGFLLVVEKFV